MPWITDVEILNELILKLNEGLGVELLLLNDDSNSSKSEYYNKIVARGGKVFLVDKGNDDVVDLLNMNIDNYPSF